MNRINRRRFLQAAAVGGLTYAFGRTPQAAFAATAGTNALFDDYKALVCVFLFGGNDSFNMLVPRSNAEYAEYAASRQNLGIAQSSLLPLNPLVPDPGGALYGLHPSMGDVATLFEQDEACAIVANVGPLIEPTTKAQFQAGSVRLPPQLFSHNDQQDQWHALKGQVIGTSGWAGRVADVITGPRVPAPLAPMATSDPPNETRSWNMKCTMRHSLIAHSSSGRIPRNATSCGRKWPVADWNSANRPDSTRLRPVKNKSGRPSPNSASKMPRLSGASGTRAPPASRPVWP